MIMKLKISLVDDQFENNGITQTRNIARGIVFNNENKIALLKIKRNDIFGNTEYYETPGGGMENKETLNQAVIREIDEEIGYQVEVISSLGTVVDYYNLIERKNINHYFLCRAIKETNIHRVSQGDNLISQVLWVNIDEAIDLYESLKDTGIDLLIKRRELPFLLEAKKYLNRRKI
ncbi:MAG: NUDIX hydrolase [Bacillales bacterium]|nr:NUDIX hydrolase [Bacillales bacterium]